MGEAMHLHRIQRLVQHSGIAQPIKSISGPDRCYWLARLLDNWDVALAPSLPTNSAGA
ncbi:MAG: hypothetical protein HWE39_25555 [Oceanospirillaceae bacterium]|nr:hypothetical protein [Oceanospirillaceae bacterium]